MYVCMFVYMYVFWVPGLRYIGLGTWATGNPDLQTIGSCVCMYVCMYVFWVPGLRYLGLGTWATGNPDLQAFGSCVCMYVCMYVCIYVCILGTWARVPKHRYLGDGKS